MAGKVKAFGYVRVSGKGQVDGDGFPRQVEAIRAYAESHGLELVKVYREEGVSGTQEDRPTLARLMVDLEQSGPKVKTVVVERLDRLARDLMVQEGIIRDFRAQGVSLVSACAAEGDLLSEDPTRKLVRQVLGAIAEYDRVMVVLKLKAARERAKVKAEAEGKPRKCEGRKNTREVAPEVVALVRSLRHHRRMTYRAIADHLNAQGLRTVTGLEWTPTNVQTMYDRSKSGGSPKQRKQRWIRAAGEGQE